MSTTSTPWTEPWVQRIADEAARQVRENYAHAPPARIRQKVVAARQEIHNTAKLPPVEIIDELLRLLRTANRHRDYGYIAHRALVLHAAARALAPPF